MTNKNGEHTGMPGKYIALNKEGNKYQFDIDENGNTIYNGEQLDAKIETEADGLTYIKYKNRKYPVEIIEKNQNKYQILINNVSYNFSVETPTSYRRKKFLNKKFKDNKEGQLQAPMPGKIIDILAEEGNDVKAGEPVLILEAMKMQNEITVPRSGKVKSIKVQPGESVMKDDILLELEK
jgi:propionyl-CoA carboxylase alpha chain